MLKKLLQPWIDNKYSSDNISKLLLFILKYQSITSFELTHFFHQYMQLNIFRRTPHHGQLLHKTR